MRPDEIEVKARSVFAGDEFALALHPDTGRPTVKHQANRRPRGALVAVYATARDSEGVLEVDVLSRALVKQIFASRELSEQALAREGESYATRKMTIRLLGAPPAAVA